MNNFNQLCMRWMAACLVLLAGLLPGCGSSDGSDLPPLFTIEVTIDGLPAEQVRVTLVAANNRQGEVLLEGISDIHGEAGMKSVAEAATAQADEFVVICESLGDWQIKEPWSSASKSPLTIVWNGEENLSVALPKKAVRHL